MQIMIVSLCALILAMLSPAAALADAAPVGNTQQQVISLIQRAENMCDTGRPEEALPLLSAAAELKPDAADIYRVWGCAYDKQGEWLKAEEKYKKWAELNPQSYRPYEALGREAYKQGRFRESNDYFEQAERLNPNRSYIADSRCHNFVLLQQWPDAIAGCTEAIALNPKDGYAYGERSKAERAARENDKADSDVSAARKYDRDFSDGRLMRYRGLFPVVLGAISAAFIVIGLGVLLRKKPLMFSSKWMFALMLVCFSPQLFMLFVIPSSPGDQHGIGLVLIKWLIPLMFTVLLIFLWLQMQGYVLFGISDKSFRKALLSVLDELNLERQEELSLIRIPAAQLGIQIAIQSWMGTGQIKSKSKSGKQAFQQIIDGLKKRFARGEVETNNVTPVIYIVLGIIMLALCVALMNI
jgi:tetratricopeptide (TPR) repeat protein